jgi:hypothetical protein
MAKVVQWLKHVKKFLKEKDKSPANRKVYAAKYLLNYNTFRAKIADYIVSDAYKNSIRQQTPERSLKREMSQKTNPKTASRKKERATGAYARVAEHAPKNKNILTREDTTRSFLPKNTTGIVHGSFAKQSFFDQESDYSTKDEEDLLSRLYIQVTILNDCTINLQAGLREKYANGEAMKRKSVDDNGKVTEVELLEDQAMYDLTAKTIPATAEATKIYVQAKTKLDETKMKMKLLPPYSKKEMSQITMDIIVYREEYGMSAKDTCNAFYVAGIEPPAGIAKEYEIELRDAEPPIPEGKGITADQAAEFKRTLLSKREAQPAWLAAKEEENAIIYAGKEGVGNETTTTRKENVND